MTTKKAPAKAPAKKPRSTAKPKESATPKRAPPKPQPLELAQLDSALLTKCTAAVILGGSISYVDRLIASGKLAAVRDGDRFTRIRASEVKRYAASLA